MYKQQQMMTMPLASVCLWGGVDGYCRRAMHVQLVPAAVAAAAALPRLYMLWARVCGLQLLLPLWMRTVACGVDPLVTS